MAAAYDEGRILLPKAETAWAESVDGLVAPGSTLIDIGAGTGRFARLFASRMACRVIAVEPANGMRSQGVEAPRPRRRVAVGRAESLPIRRAAADVVWLAGVVHYLTLSSQGRG
jgi:ubiquinone/menaquinone biosynthesis C-methylase UbiE